MPNRSLVPGWIQSQNDSTQYGYQGFDPELAAEAQALNRKQQIANALLQQGMQAPQGQMAGRFYVPPAWSQYLNQAGSSILGAVLTNKFNNDRKSLEDQNRQQTADAVQRYMEGMYGKKGTIVEGERPEGQQAVLAQMQGPLPGVTEPTEPVPYADIDPAMFGTKVPFDTFAATGGTPSPGMSPQANAYAGYLRGNEAPEGSPDPLTAASVNQRIGEMADALYPPPPATMPLRDSERFATAPIETQAPLRELEETFRPTGLAGYAPAEAQGPGAPFKTPDTPATPETQMQAMVQAMTSRNPGLVQLAKFTQESQAAQRKAAEDRAFKREEAQTTRDFNAEQRTLDREQRSADQQTRLEADATLRKDLAAQQDALRRELHATPSGSALANVDAQSAIALQSHNDRMMQFEQNKKQDEQTLDLRRQQGLSEQEYKRDKMAMEERHQKAQEKLEKEKLEIQKQIHGAQMRGENKPPAGYRYTKDGNLEAIPGGPADQKLQGQLNQDTAALGTINASLDNLITNARALRNHPGLPGITGWQGKVPNFPGGDAANANALLDSLRSKTAVSAIQDMRNMSKSGGAVGQVTQQEWPRLENLYQSLDRAQGTPAFQKALDDLIEYAEGSRGRVNDAFNMKHKGQAPAVAPPAQPAPPKGGGWSIKPIP